MAVSIILTIISTAYQPPINYYYISTMKDPIVQIVIDKYQERSNVGINKYGTTLQDNKLELVEWLNHAQEEAMDFVLYLEKIKQELK